MKYCMEYAALLDLYVDGELTPDEMARVRAHLETCPGCQAYVDDALTIRAAFPDVEDTAVPADFAGGVMERIRRTSEPDGKVREWRWRSVRRWTGTLAAVAACCALVILVKNGSGSSGGASAGADSGVMMAVAGGGDMSAPAACDTGAVEFSANRETGPGAAPETPEVSEVEEEKQEVVQVQTTGRSGDVPMEYDNEAAVNEKGEEWSTAAAMPAESAPEEAAADQAATALYLTREEAERAGELLKEHTPVQEDAVSWTYALNEEEYQALLEALGRPEELSESVVTIDGLYLVVVNEYLE